MFDPVAELGVAVKEVAAENRHGWSGLALSDRVLGLAATSERLQVEVVRAISGWDAVAAWAEDGALTPVTWLCQRFPVTHGEALILVKVARLYGRYPAVAAALDGGEIALAHARILARAEKDHTDAFAECLDGLLDVARQTETLKDFAQVIAEWVQLVDDREPGDDSKGTFHSSDTFGGKAHTELSGSSDDAAIMRAAIEALDTLDPPDCPEGPRTRAQRHYDIAMDIFRRALADQLGDEPDPAGGADVILDADTAAALMADPDAEADQLDLGGDHCEADKLAEFFAPFRPRCADARHGHDSTCRCEFADGSKASLAFAAALLCSGWVRWVVRDPETGAVLNMGRRQRLFSRTQRRALVIRDGGCVFPGCDRGPRWCDAHHILPWEHLGLTDLDNGALLCRRHHRLVHHGWRLHRDAATGIVTATAPDGRTFTRKPDIGRRPQTRC